MISFPDWNGEVPEASASGPGQSSMFPLARDLPQSEFRSDGGLGVARLTTFDKHGCFFPRTGHRVSAIGVGRFCTDRGLAMLHGELLWIGPPAGMLAVSDCFF
ncbi:MAG: hypothetical protein DMG56_25365 [Acidobacteria bacterium]|nr:MAG: hypothetical protein DMG56_25365 [Acidobacteriota bacterium]PYU60360.1 MAG: hypothetical protein DMG55_10885 [Acidobacteriota bacterium]